jgi:uncharacterized protein YecA (UPF0149 family)
MNFFKKIINKIIGSKETEAQTETIKEEKQKEKQEEKTKPQVEEKKENKKTLEEKSDEELISELNNLAPGIFSQAKTPEMKKLIIDIYKKMLNDGVNLQNEKEVERWMQKNQDLFAKPSQKIETYRREKPKVGRNDPCPCGSGKKYKKCCGANE